MSCDISYIDACEMLHTYNDSEDDTGDIGTFLFISI